MADLIAAEIDIEPQVAATISWARSTVAVASDDLGRPDEATKQVLAYSDRALLGRMSRMANDALLGFAALAIDRGGPLTQPAFFDR